MKSRHVLKSVVVASACALALVVAVGCTSTTASSSSASASASSADASASSAAQSSAASAAASQQASASSASAEDKAAAEEKAIAEGYQVFKGTVHVANGEEMIELQGIDIDPAAAGGGGTFAVLVFDQETQVTGMSADGSGERTEPAKMIGIAEYTEYGDYIEEYGDLELCKSLDGQQATVAAKSQDILFPSDVRFPIGEPEARVNMVL